MHFPEDVSAITWRVVKDGLIGSSGVIVFMVLLAYALAKGHRKRLGKKDD